MATKATLVEAFKEAADLPSTAEAARLVNTMLDCLQTQLVSDGEITLAGFGAFIRRTRKAREGRNPQTGEAIKIGATANVGFRAAKQLKEAVNSKQKPARSRRAA